MSSNLKKGERHRSHDELFRRRAYSELQHGYRLLKAGISSCECGEKYAPSGYKRELYDCEGHRLREGGENGLGGGVGEDGGHVPYAA